MGSAVETAIISPALGEIIAVRLFETAPLPAQTAVTTFQPILPQLAEHLARRSKCHYRS
jgi:hypothetical protein